MESEMICVTKAEYVRDYVLRLWFNNNEVRMFDFSKIYDKGIFVKLKDMNYFRNFTLDPFTVDWNNEIGFAPEFLFEKGYKEVA